MTTPLFAYLDAGAGAALAALIASGAVGARAVLGATKDKLRRRGGDADGGGGAEAVTKEGDR